jgi:hypothetical protein
VYSAFNLNNSFVSANSIVAVLEVEAEGEVGSVLKEDFADRAVNNVVDR